MKGSPTSLQSRVLSIRAMILNCCCAWVYWGVFSLNSFIDVQLTCNKLHILKVYSLISCNTYEMISTIKTVNISITLKHLMPLCEPSLRLVFILPSPSLGGLLKTTHAQDHICRDSDQLVQSKGQASGLFKAPWVVLMCNQSWESLYYTLLLISAEANLLSPVEL